MQIDVTETDIKEGEPGSVWRCPIALALNRAGFKHAQVWGSKIEYRSQLYKTPEYVRTWLMDFDIDGRVTPLTFEFSPNETSN